LYSGESHNPASVETDDSMTEEAKICDPARSVSAWIMTLIMFSPELPLDAFVAICKKAKMPQGAAQATIEEPGATPTLRL
jgi:hypothetical protein